MRARPRGYGEGWVRARRGIHAGGAGVTRVIKCRVAVNAGPFAPKSTRVEKLQRMRAFEGDVFVVESSSRSFDVPYGARARARAVSVVAARARAGDYFTTEDKWIVMPVGCAGAPPLPATAQVPPSGDSCRLIVAAGLKFQRSTMLKGQIVARSRDGIRAFYTTWMSRAPGVIAGARDRAGSALLGADAAAGADAGAAAGADAAAAARAADELSGEFRGALAKMNEARARAGGGGEGAYNAAAQRMLRVEARWRAVFLLACVTALLVLLAAVLPALYRGRRDEAGAGDALAAAGACPLAGGDAVVESIVREVLRRARTLGVDAHYI